MNPRAKTLLMSLVKFAIPAAIIFWLLWRMEPEQWEQLREQPKNYPLLVSALLVALGVMTLSFLRWWLLVRCQDIELSVIEALRLGSIGFLLSFVSAGSVGGDLFKAIFLAKRSPGRRFEAVASVFVDRGVGLLGLVLLVSVAFAFVEPKSESDGRDIARIAQASMLLTGVGFGVIAVLILGGKPIDRLIQWAATWPVVGGLVERIAGPLRMFHRHPIAFGISVLMSVAVHVLLAISVWMIAKGMYSEPPTLSDHLVIVPLANVVAALPIAPAGLGVMEAAMEWLYRVIPSIPTQSSGTLVALVYELVKVLMAIIGIVFYWSAGRELKSSLEEAEKVGHGENAEPAT
jgi:uncharacterized protein (TIRG00374 family)